MSNISTHILDTAKGCPAAGVPVTLERQEGDGWRRLREAVTDDDGRVKALLTEPMLAGLHRISFAVRDYHDRVGVQSFFPHVTIDFDVTDAGAHYHVPLLLSPFGYSTYRGS